MKAKLSSSGWRPYAQTLITSISLVLSLAMAASPLARADENDPKYQEYVQQLQRAGRVAQGQSDDAGGSALEAGHEGTAIEFLKLKRRFLKVGDTWTIELRPAKNNWTKRIAVDDQNQQISRDPITYTYRVTETGTYKVHGADRRWAEITIEVEEDQAKSLARSKNPVALKLVINDLYHGVGKTYVYKNKDLTAVTNEVPVGLDGRKNVSSGMDRFPIDLPNVSRSNGAVADQDALETLRTEITQYRAAGLQFEKTLAFGSLDEATDLPTTIDSLGRKITIAWQRDHVWPSYTHSAAGIAVLRSQTLVR